MEYINQQMKFEIVRKFSDNVFSYFLNVNENRSERIR